MSFPEIYVLGWLSFVAIAFGRSLWTGRDRGRRMRGAGDVAKCFAWTFVLGFFFWWAIALVQLWHAIDRTLPKSI